MGMYDFLNDSIVKCFYSPVCYKFKEDSEMSLHRIDGSLKGYKDGDILPTKTLYYNLPQSFVILDNKNLVVNIVENSKLLKSQNLFTDLSIEDIKDKPIFNTSGVKLNLLFHDLDSFKKEATSYSKAILENMKNIKSVYKKYNLSSKKMIELHKIVYRDSSLEECLDYFNEDDFEKLNAFLKTKHIKITLSLENLSNSKFSIKSLVLDNFIGEDVANFIKNDMFLDVFNRLDKSSKSEIKIIESHITPIKEEFDHKWYIYENEKEKELGEYLSILFGLQHISENIPELYNSTDKEEFRFCLFKAKEMIYSDNNLLKSYFDCMDVDKDTQLKINKLLNTK